MDWPGTPGKVIESSVGRRRSSGSNGGSSTTYHAEILYEFTVESTKFNGNRVAYGDYGSSNPSHARRVVNRYPKGKNVTVHYMPGNPEECLLEPGLKGQSWFLPGVGLIFFVVGSGMAVFGDADQKGNASLIRCRVCGNRAMWYALMQDVNLYNCAIDGNSGAYSAHNCFDILNCTIMDTSLLRQMKTTPKLRKLSWESS